MSKTPIFEQSTSPLYRSNDGRLEVHFELKGTGTEYFIKAHGVTVEEVFRTLDRTLADAYIAGYDLATS